MGQEITKEYNEIVTDIGEIQRKVQSRNLDQETKDKYKERLLFYATKLSNNNRIKKRHKEDALRQISTVLTQLLNGKHLDIASVETSSIKYHRKTSSDPELHKAKNYNDEKPRHNSLDKSKKRKSAIITKFKPTMDDIEAKLNAMKHEISSLMENNDLLELKYKQRIIQTLATDLEMMEDEDGRKKKLEKDLTRWYQKIERFKRDTKRNDNIEYLQLQNLETVKKDFNEIKLNDDNSNYDEIKNQLIAAKVQIETTENINKDVEEKKKEILEVVLFKMEELSDRKKLNQARANFLDFKSKVSQNPTKEDYKSYCDYIEQLQQYVEKLCSLRDEDKQEFYQALEDFLNGVAVIDQRRSGISIKDAENHQKFLETLNQNNDRQPRDETKMDETDKIQETVQPITKIQETVQPIMKIQETVQPFTKINQEVIKTPDASLSKEISVEDFCNIWDKLKPKLSNADLEEKRKNCKLLSQLAQSVQETVTTLDQVSYGEGLIRTNAKIYDLAQVKRISVKDEQKEKEEEPILKRHSGIEETFNDIMKMKEDVDQIESTINEMKTITKNDQYYYLKNQLKKYEIVLNHLPMSHFENIEISKKNLTAQIKKNLKVLDTKLGNGPSTSPEIRKEMKHLKEKVDRFSGTYGNILYREIEKGLKHCLKDIDGDVNNEKTLQDLRNEINNYLKILENKSIKDCNYNKAPPLPRQLTSEEELEKIEKDLDLLRPQIMNFTGSEREFHEYDDLLLLHTIKLDKIMDQNLINQKIGLLKEIQELSNVLEHKYQEYEVVEEELEDILEQVENFQGYFRDDQYNKLDERLINLQIRLEKSDLDDDKKKKFIKRIHNGFKKLKEVAIKEGTLV